MKLVYSLYIGKDNHHNGAFCGYQSSEDLLDSLLLSSTVSSRHFTSCELYCNSHAAKLIEADGRNFPFTGIHTCFDHLDGWLRLHNWAYPKLVTYSLQTTPFVHLDYDAILVDGLPPALLKQQFIFQQQECITPYKYTYYKKLHAEALQLGLLPSSVMDCPDFAMNMGLFACTRAEALPMVGAYCDAAFAYVHGQQQRYEEVILKHEQPMLFEQLFVANMLQNHQLKEGIDYDTFISPQSKNKFLPAYRFSHFYSDWKRKHIIVVAIKKELQRLGLERKVKPAA
jgi:hypothetical protein